jgi:hypothetical protein
MDCFEMHRNSNNGQYWAHASHFLYCSEAHGQVFFPELLKYLNNDKSSGIKELRSAFQKPFRNLLFQVRKRKLNALKICAMCRCLLYYTAWIICFQGELEPSGSAEEFLLNPWVIVQLPFQHAILHQWIVVFYAETLKFQNEVSDLLIISYPSEMRSALKSLSKIMSTLSHFINTCHEYLFSNLWKNPSSPLSSNECTKQLPDVLPMLKFILSEKSQFVIKALKRMAWNRRTCKESKMEAPISKEEKTRLFQYSSMYHFLNWQKFPAGQMFHSPKDTRVEYKSWRSLEAQKFQTELVVGELHENVSAMNVVVEERIIKTGRLSGVSKETIFRGVENTGYFIYKVFKQYKFLKGKLAKIFHMFDTVFRSYSLVENFVLHIVPVCHGLEFPCFLSANKFI